MTVLDVPNYIYYAGDGGTTSFPFPYKFFEDAELNVYSITSTATTLLGAGYTISKTGSAPYDSCDVVMTVAPASGTTLLIERLCDVSQEVDLPTGGAFRESVIEGALDKITMIAQQLDRDIGRGIKVPLALASSGADLDFPSPVADYIIGWDATGLALESKHVSSLGGLVTTAFTESFLSGVTDAQGMRDYSGVSTSADILAAVPSVAANMDFENLSFTASVAAKALTVTLKGADGNAPSASNLVCIPFRSGTTTSATLHTREVSSAASGTSIVLSSGSTLGFTAAEAGRIYVWAIDNAGTVELALSRTADIFPESKLVLTYAEGGAGAADSGTSMFSTAAQSNVACRCIGYIEITTGAVAGEWDNAPTKVQVMGPGIKRTGDVVQRVNYTYSSYATTNTQIPCDDTLPQSGEGAEAFTQAVTFTSAINKAYIQVILHLGASGNVTLVGALFQDSGANALSSAAILCTGNTYTGPMVFNHSMTTGTTVPTTFKVRFGPAGGFNIYLNGWSGSRYLGGTMYSGIDITEVFA